VEEGLRQGGRSIDHVVPLLLTCLRTLHNVTHFALHVRTLVYYADHFGRGVSTFLSEVTRPARRLSRLSGELQIFVRVRHVFGSFRRPFGSSFEYTVQLFSVTDQLDFSRVRLQFKNGTG